MSERTTWERVDAPAATPQSARPGSQVAATGAGSAPTAARRLRRSRSPVMAAFDGGGDVFQRRLRDVLVGSAMLLVPLVVLNLVTTVLAFDRFDPDDTLFPSLGSGTRTGIEDVAPVLAAVAASVATAVVGWFVSSIVVAERLGGVGGVGGEVSSRLWPTLGRTVRALPAVLVAWGLSHWWQPLVAVSVVSTDTATAVAILTLVAPLALVASAVVLFVVPAMVAETLGPVGAVRRSWVLFRRAPGTALGFVALSTLLGSMYLVGVATLAPLLEGNGMVDLGDAAWVVQGVLLQLGVLIVMPLIAAATAQCYVEVRLDREGLDLLVDAESAFGSGGDRGRG